MRRRTLLGSIDYVFSAQSTSVSVGYSSSYTNVNITSTVNGSNVGYTVVDYDGTVVTAVTTAATSVRIYYSTNSGDSQRNGYVVLKQDGSNKTITISLSQPAASYVFSASTTSVSISYSASSTSINIKSTANGSNIGYSAVSVDGTVVTSVTSVSTASTYVRIYYRTNSTYGQRHGSVTLKQDGSDKTITINLSQSAHPLELGHNGILLDGDNGSSGSIPTSDNVSFSNVPSWANVTYSDGKINVTASSANSASTARSSTMTVSGGSQSTTLTLIQLPSDYHSREYVTIGDTKWSIKNVGASSVQNKGNCYMYGKGSRVYNSSDSTYTGTENPLASSADTATQVMGSGWRMPTLNEPSNLANNSTYYWVSYNGVNGGVFNSSGNVLFFPAAGYYSNGFNYGENSYCYFWASTPNGSSSAYFFQFTYASDLFVIHDSREKGFSVRGVQA